MENNNVNLFTPEEKSGFKYWFAHWNSFNMTALNLKCWKWKYLLHDIEKPWLKLLWGDYQKVREWHRKNNRHHLTYKNPNKIDWEAMILDWECSRFTKQDSPKTAREMYEYFITVRYERGVISEEMKNKMVENIPPILEKLNL